MVNYSKDNIPSLDLKDFIDGSGPKKEEFVANLQEILYACVTAFFNLPEHMKKRYEIAELKGQRGYIGKMKEHAKGHTTPDLKEFYHIGQVIDPNDFETRLYPQNIFPKEIPGIKRTSV